MHTDKHSFFQLLFLCFLLFGSTVCAQEFKQIRDGIEHAQFTRQVKINEKETAPVVVNALRLNLKKTRLDVVHAMNAAIGVEKTSSIAVRHSAFAAINAGFFRLDKSVFNGDPQGIFMVDGKLLSESYADRVALLILNKSASTEIDIKPLYSYGDVWIDKKQLRLSGINRMLKADDLVIFTPEFNRTTLSGPESAEVIVSKNKIIQISNDAGNSVIPKDGFVISASGKMKTLLLDSVKINAKAKVKFGIKTLEVPSANLLDKNVGFDKKKGDIVGGVPLLIRDGRILITWEEEKSSKAFAETRHPRTAIAKLKDGRALLVTVDGRQPGVSAGMNLQELAEMLSEFGATDAMNLDGGGSTTMFLDGKVVNRPSDKEGERAVSDAILVTLRN